MLKSGRKNNEFCIAGGGRNRCSGDSDLIREFAEIKKLSAWCEVTDSYLHTAIFGEKSFVQSLVALSDGISLENGFPGGGFLNTAGRVSSIPAFDDYDGSLLVFIHESTTSRRPNSGIWIISISNAVLK